MSNEEKHADRWYGVINEANRRAACGQSGWVVAVDHAEVREISPKVNSSFTVMTINAMVERFGHLGWVTDHRVLVPSHVQRSYIEEMISQLKGVFSSDSGDGSEAVETEEDPVAVRKSVNGKWSVSTDEENYQGVYETKKEAIEAGFAKHDQRYWVAQIRDPISPEELFCRYSVEDWLEQRVYDHGDYSGVYAEGSFELSLDQQKELAAEIRATIGKWIRRKGISPKHFVVNDAEVTRIDVEF